MEKRYQKTYTITTNYLDRFDDLSPKGALDLFQDIAARHAETLGAGFDEMIKKDLMWVIARNHLKYISPLPYGEDVVLETWPLRPTRFYFDRIYRLKSLSGNLIALGRSRWLIVDRVTRKMQSSSVYSYPLAQCEEDNPFLEDFPTLTKVEPNNSPVLKHEVLRSDIDHNEHFNNTRYADLVYNSLELDQKNGILELYLYYYHELRLGEVLRLFKKQEGKNVDLSAYKEDTLVFQAHVVLR